jgi:ABC-type cobalamin/Fe3+-siderophores transport system ATPase subunit
VLVLEELEYCQSGKPLIKNVTTHFEPGRIYGLLGPNGSGKSTLLKSIAGIWRPTRGKVLWKGDDITRWNRQAVSRVISTVPQNPIITFDYTVLEMVAMGRYPHDSAPLQCGCQQAVVEEALRMVDGWHLRDRPVTRISSGERQRIYIARSLATQSPVLLLDEPTASLDVRHQREIWLLLDLLKFQQKVIVVATHDLVAIKRHAQQLILMNDGCCIATGDHDAVLTSQRLSDLFGL